MDRMLLIHDRLGSSIRNLKDVLFGIVRLKIRISDQWCLAEGQKGEEIEMIASLPDSLDFRVKIADYRMSLREYGAN